MFPNFFESLVIHVSKFSVFTEKQSSQQTQPFKTWNEVPFESLSIHVFIKLFHFAPCLLVSIKLLPFAPCLLVRILGNQKEIQDDSLFKWHTELKMKWNGQIISFSLFLFYFGKEVMEAKGCWPLECHWQNIRVSSRNLAELLVGDWI